MPVALGLPLFISAGVINGTAFALARADDELYYLVDHATVDGPPVWVHEGEVDKCFIAPLPVNPR
jgi:hypothetical protein